MMFYNYVWLGVICEVIFSAYLKFYQIVLDNYNLLGAYNPVWLVGKLYNNDYYKKHLEYLVKFS